MKDLINDATVYWMAKNGGYSVDKRTWAGKDLVTRVKTMNVKRLQKVAYECELCCAELVTLRFKDLKTLLQDNICEN